MSRSCMECVHETVCEITRDFTGVMNKWEEYLVHELKEADFPYSSTAEKFKRIAIWEYVANCCSNYISNEFLLTLKKDWLDK